MITANVIVSLTLLQLIIYAACGFDKGANRMSGKIAKAQGVEEDEGGCAFVVHDTTPYAISRRVAQPSGGNYARSKRWRKRSGAGRDARRRALRIACCAG